MQIRDDLVYNSEQLDLQKPMQLLENDIRILYNKIDDIINDAVLNDIIEKAENYASELHEIDLEYMECNKLIGLDDDRVVQLLKRFNTLNSKISELEYLQNESNKESTELDEILNMQETIENFGDDDDKQRFRDLSETYKKLILMPEAVEKNTIKKRCRNFKPKFCLTIPTS